MELTRKLKNARAVGVPLIAVQTADQIAASATIAAGLNGKSPVIGWDCVRGFYPLTDDGRITAMPTIPDPATRTNFYEAMGDCLNLPERTVIIVQMADRYFDGRSSEVLANIQSVANLRDSFKTTRRTLIMLGTGFSLPPELGRDVLVLDEELPDADQVNKITSGFFSAIGAQVDADTQDKVRRALIGLPAFGVEQAAALSLLPNKSIDIDACWERKRGAINQVRGLRFERSDGAVLDEVGGDESIIRFFKGIFNGPDRPSLIVFLDEIDKSMAGAGAQTGIGDSSGASQDAHGVLLREIEDRGHLGALLLGPPGCGKTYIARALARTFSTPLVALDMGALKNSYLGASEANVRLAMQTIAALAGGPALFLATCNKLETLSPELRRRFSKLGLWFFDLPSAEERKAIGEIQCKRLGLESDPAFWAGANGWSGANIRDCADLAHALGATLKDASEYVVPAAVQDPAGLTRLREMAAGKFFDAGKPGRYQMPVTAPSLQRAIDLN